MFMEANLKLKIINKPQGTRFLPEKMCEREKMALQCLIKQIRCDQRGITVENFEIEMCCLNRLHC